MRFFMIAATQRRFSILAGALALTALFAMSNTTSVALAAEKKQPETKEQREKMASLHERMAACLRSDKPMEECHREMRENCCKDSEKEDCPMMSKMHGHTGDHHHGHHEHDAAHDDHDGHDDHDDHAEKGKAPTPKASQAPKKK